MNLLTLTRYFFMKKSLEGAEYRQLCEELRADPIFAAAWTHTTWRRRSVRATPSSPRRSSVSFTTVPSPSKRRATSDTDSWCKYATRIARCVRLCQPCSPRGAIMPCFACRSHMGPLLVRSGCVGSALGLRTRYESMLAMAPRKCRRLCSIPADCHVAPAAAARA